jgi:hypothetical protein
MNILTTQITSQRREKLYIKGTSKRTYKQYKNYIDCIGKHTTFCKTPIKSSSVIESNLTAAAPSESYS